MENTRSGNKNLVSIYNTYYQFIHRAKNKSLSEFKRREPECFRLLAPLARNSEKNFRNLLPMLTRTQRWVFKEWLDSVSYHAKDSALVWRNMTPESLTDTPSFTMTIPDDSSNDEPEEKRILLSFFTMKNALKKIRKMSKYDLGATIPPKEIDHSLKEAKKALVTIIEIKRFLEKKDPTSDRNMLEDAIKDCNDIDRELANFYACLGIGMGEVPKLTKDTKAIDYPSQKALTHTAPLYISMVPPITLESYLKHFYKQSKQVKKEPSTTECTEPSVDTHTAGAC